MNRQRFPFHPLSAAQLPSWVSAPVNRGRTASILWLYRLTLRQRASGLVGMVISRALADSITGEQERLMRHALGLSRSAKPYRNRYFSNGRNWHWEDLCQKGLAISRPWGDGFGNWVYSVTKAGHDRLGVEMEVEN